MQSRSTRVPFKTAIQLQYRMDAIVLLLQLYNYVIFERTNKELTLNQHKNDTLE